MKLKHIWTVLCEESVISQDNNMISLRNAVELLNVSLKPADKSQKVNLTQLKTVVPTRLELISFLSKKSEFRNRSVQGFIKVDYINPAGTIINTNENEFELKTNITNLRTRLKIQNIPIDGEGEYIFRVSIKETKAEKGNIVTEIPLMVKLAFE
jgi:hypothetical protein